MKHGKREMPREHRSHKGLTALVALALIFCCAVGGTVAWLTTSTGPVTNTFTPTKVETEIGEDVTTDVKKDVVVKNKGDIPVFVRAAIIVNWVDDNGNVYAAKPVAGEDNDYIISLNTTNWTLASDGFYYYNSTVPAGGSTGNLINTCKPVVDKAPDGYTLRVTILAEAIQADGESGGQYAVETVWPVKVNPTDKTLSIKN